MWMRDRSLRWRGDQETAFSPRVGRRAGANAGIGLTRRRHKMRPRGSGVPAGYQPKLPRWDLPDLAASRTALGFQTIDAQSPLRPAGSPDLISRCFRPRGYSPSQIFRIRILVPNRTSGRILYRSDRPSDDCGLLRLQR